MKLKKYDDIRKLLLQKKALLLKADRNIEQDLQTDIEGRRQGDSADLAETIQEQEMAISMKTRGQGELKQISEALERIAKGDYGSCAECDEEISQKRLAIQPYSIYCVECQQRHETNRELSPY